MHQLESRDHPQVFYGPLRGSTAGRSIGGLSQAGMIQSGMVALIVVMFLIGAGAYWQFKQPSKMPPKIQKDPASLPPATVPVTASPIPEPALALYPARLSLVTNTAGELIGCSGIVGDATLRQQLIQQISAVFIEQYQPCDLTYDPAYQADLMEINAITRLAQILQHRPNVMIAINPLHMIPLDQVIGLKGAVMIGTPSAEEYGKIATAVREQTGNAFSLHQLQPVALDQTVLNSVQTASQMLKSLPASPRPADITALLNQQVIRFDFDAAEVPALNQPLLALVAPYLQQYPHLQLEIRAFTSAVGSPQYNLDLSQRRAQAIRQAWIEQGVDAQQLIAIGMGQQQAIAENTTEQGQFWNERIEFRWVEPQADSADSMVETASAATDVPTDLLKPKNASTH